MAFILIMEDLEGRINPLSRRKDSKYFKVLQEIILLPSFK